MSDAKSNILQRLHSVERDDSAKLEREVITQPWDKEEKLKRFSERMQAVRAEVHRASRMKWSETLIRILQEKGVRHLAYAPSTHHGRIVQADLWSSDIELIPYEKDIESWKDRLFNETDAAITGCRGAIAETGSLILWPNKTEPRLLSLVPPVHCVLLQADQIYSTFAEAMREQAWEEGMPTNALLISGPSKSADIAQVLAYGVHGPKSLVVLVID
jgi:L-lactate dehydrogenase complex protein LldG